MTESQRITATDSDGKLIHMRRVSAVCEYRPNYCGVWQEISGNWLIQQPPNVLRALADLIEREPTQ